MSRLDTPAVSLTTLPVFYPILVPGLRSPNYYATTTRPVLPVCCIVRPDTINCDFLIFLVAVVFLLLSFGRMCAGLSDARQGYKTCPLPESKASSLFAQQGTKTKGATNGQAVNLTR